MRRRPDIAMSLIGNPPVIFLDEPTAGLDPQARIEVWQAVKELAEHGTTVLLTTQYLDEYGSHIGRAKSHGDVMSAHQDGADACCMHMRNYATALPAVWTQPVAARIRLRTVSELDEHQPASADIAVARDARHAAVTRARVGARDLSNRPD